MGAVRELVGGRQRARRAAKAASAERSVTVQGTPEALYRAWLDPALLRRALARHADVTALDDGRFRWVLRGPLGQDLAWDTRLVEEGPFERLRWARVGDGLGAELELRFRPSPLDRGTVVTVALHFLPTDGPLAPAARKLDALLAARGVAGAVARDFKALVEAGEIPTTARQPAARDGGRDP